MKKLRKIIIGILLIFILYSTCTIPGAMKLKAFIISRNPLVYTSNFQLSSYGEPYYVLDDEMIAADTYNSLGVFECRRKFIFVQCDYIGMP